MVTQGIAVFVLLTRVLGSPDVRQLSYAKITGYEPASDVIQHNRLDLDQSEMEAHLKTPDFIKAKSIYENGAHSGAHARVTVSPLAAALAKGKAVTQAGNTAAEGYVKKAKGSGVTEVDVTYTSTCVDNKDSKDYSVAGCYNTAGALTVDGAMDIGKPSVVENRYRTLAGFSTAAGTKMAGQPVFEKFKKYYGYPDYGNRYVMAALEGSGIFAGQDAVARVEGVKKGAAYLNVWMYVIREMEDAVDDCQAGCVDCNDDPVHAWDEAVAFYSGSLEGVDGAGSGKMLYALADKRCKNYKTCVGGTNSGTSVVNRELMELFKLGQAKLLQGKCSEVPGVMKSIVQFMTVPLVQGALRYAYKVGELQGKSKEKAEGAVFSAAVLPLVDSCKPSAATLIAKNMNIDSATPMTDGFAAVKDAFESTYSCLGITCAQVGGLLVTETTYYDGFGPCGVEEASATATTDTPATASAATSSFTAASLSAFASLVFLVIRNGLW